MNANELKALHAMVWEYRAELTDVWPTPSPDDAAEFVISELGEVADAHMRTKPGYARNNERETNELDEWADVVMMLLTMIGPEEYDVERFFPLSRWQGRSVAYLEVLTACRSTWTGATVVHAARAFNAVNMIATMDGMIGQLPERVRNRLERIKARHGK